MNFPKTLALALLCCIPFGAAHADGAENGFILLIDEDAPGARALTEGRYDDAAEVASGARMHADEVGASTVACAALIAARDLEAATEVCDESVELAQRPITTVWNPRGHRDREALAMAYSNRAVLRWLRGDAGGASADVDFALRQNRYTDEVSHNQQRSVVAQLSRND